MKPVPLIALFLSIAAFATALLKPAPAAETAISQPPRPNDELAALERRLDVLEETSEHLEQRVGELLRRPAGIALVGDAGVPAALALEVAQLKSEVRGMIAGEALNSEGGRAYLKDAVRGVQDELRAEERKERAERFAAAQAQQTAATSAAWKKFVTDARLDYTQEQTLNRVLEAETTARKAMFDALRDGSKTFADLRDESRKTRETTDAEMKKALSADQYQQYTDARRETRREGGGDFGGGGRGERGQRGGNAGGRGE